MRLPARHVSIVLLLAVFIGYASVAAHAVTHASGDAAECELCISYGDASGALAEKHDHGVRPVHDTHVLTPTINELTSRQPTSIHQRGPPRIH